MTKTIKIITARPSDYSRVNRLYKQLADFPIPLCDGDIWFKQESSIKKQIKDKKISIVINKTGHLLGIISYESYCGVFEIDTLVIDKKHRRKGLGTMLINYLIKKMKRNRPLSKINVGSYKCFDCYNFYFKNGFKLEFDSGKSWEMTKEI